MKFSVSSTVSMSALAIATVFALPAHAQDVPADPGVEEEQIIVTGQREALNRALESERRSDNLVNVIEATDIGQFADQNVAESIQRVPGVTLNRSEGEGRSVSVRGLPSQFTPITVNGVRLGTSNLNTAQVSLDSISNDQLGSIEVTKAVLPSQDADTLGGSIDLKSISAFNIRDDHQLQLRAENYYVERARKSGPRLGGTYLGKFADGRLGVAASLSYLERPLFGTEFENDSGLARVPARGTTTPAFLRPEEMSVIFETGERKRINGSLNIEFRPDDRFELFARGTYSHLTDNDTSYRDIIGLDSSTGSDVVSVRPRGGRFDDGDLAKRLFFQNITDEVLTLSTGGRGAWDGWRVSGQIDFSRSKFDNPEALRGRFRERDIIVDLGLTDEAANIVFDRGVRGTAGNPFNPALYEFDQLLAVQEYRTDEVYGGRFDVVREVPGLGVGSEIAIGAKFRMRDKVNDREEFTGNPGSFGFRRTLADLPLFNQDSGYGYTSFYPELGPSLEMFRAARAALIAGNPNFQRIDLSNSGDYRVGEDVYAGYVQATIEPTPGLRIIGGVRVEHTKSDSQGFFTEFDGSGVGPGGNPGTVLDLGNVQDEYTKFFPGLHLRWEPVRSVLVRASYNRGLQRPDFDDRRNLQRVSIDTAAPTIRDLFAGNPFLEPLTADQFDATFAYYPNRDTVLQASAFYKRIDNFFVDFSGPGSVIDSLPIQIPAGVNRTFRRVTTTLNGDKAEVKGVEFQVTHSLTYLPGLLGGLFVQGNLTLVDSTSSASVRAGEEFSLPDQRDTVANISVGYEDDNFLLRLAGNHQGKALVVLGGDAEEDIFTKPSFNVDLNARIRVNSQFELTFDAINLTDQAEIVYYNGDDAGRIVSGNSAFGRSYQIGARVKF